MNYPVVMSTPEIERLFPNVYALPTSFFIDLEHRIAQKHVGLLNPSLTEIEMRSLAGMTVDARVELVDDEDKVRLANAAQANKIPGIDLSRAHRRETSRGAPAAQHRALHVRLRSHGGAVPPR